MMESLLPSAIQQESIRAVLPMVGVATLMPTAIVLAVLTTLVDMVKVNMMDFRAKIRTFTEHN